MSQNKESGQVAPRKRVGLALRRASAAGVLMSHAVAKRVGLSSSDLEALDLVFQGEPTTAGEIGRRTGLSSGAVTGLIDRLEKRGFVERSADPNDRRKVLVRVISAGVAPIAALFAPLEQRMNELLARYADDELALIAEFSERGAEIAIARVAELEKGEG